MALDPLSAGLDLANTVIGRLWPDKSEQERQQMAAALMVVQGQLDANKEEAKNPSVFVSGWRPAVGWTCALGCGWNWLLLPVTKVALDVFGYHVAVAPADLSEMMPLLLGLLGMGSLRTFEKISGVAAK